MCKVSVIIPVYNVAKYLSACLDSVLAQTLKDIEIIAIDDASLDGSGKILDEYAEKDRRIRVIHLSENHMQGYGRNRGLELAKGKYVYFLDSDDMITPSALEELFELSEEDDLDAAFFDSQTLFESEELKKRHSGYITLRKGDYPDGAVSGRELMDDFCRQDEWLVYVQREFWRKSFLIENGISNIEGIEHEDEFFSFAATLLAERVRYVRKPYFIRRYRDNSVMTRRIMPKDFHGYFLSYCRMIDLCFSGDIRTYGTEFNIMHMYDCMLNTQSVFENEADPDEWFAPEELRRYRLFLSLQSNFDTYRKREQTKWAPLGKYDHIYVYGAGRVANAAAKRITAAGHLIEYHIVTSMVGNAEYVNGCPVYELKTVSKLPDRSVIVVAMAKSLHREIEDLISDLDCDYFLYSKDILQGPFTSNNRDYHE